MARRARCRCGEMLNFRKGPAGYKMRCPSCNSVVRLKRQKPTRMKAAVGGENLDIVRHDLPAMPVAEAEQFGFAARSKSPPDFRTLVCESCSMIVATQSERCPGCGGVMGGKSFLPTAAVSGGPAPEPVVESIELQLLNSGSVKTAASRKLLLIGGISAAAILLLVAGIVVTIWLRR